MRRASGFSARGESEFKDRVSFDNSATRFDIPGVSDLDLNNLLKDWPHEPGQVKARKIAGSDGREKVQLRIDLGLIQMELNGRPDGQQPHGFESLLEYHKARAKNAKEAGTAYHLGETDLLSLQHEGVPEVLAEHRNNFIPVDL